jgi:hypothetical protein
MLRKKKSLIDRAVESASDAVDAALPVIESAVATAREQVKDLAQDTKTKAAPLLADTKVLAGEIAEATREVAIPKAKTAAAAGAASAAGLAASGKELAAAKVAEIKGEPPKKKGGKLRKLVLFGSIAAALGFVYNKMRGNAQADNWQSAYTPPSSAGSATRTSSTTSATSAAPSAGVATGGTHLAPGVGPDEPLATDDPMAKHAPETAGDDPGGASPGEALADAVEEPHEATTPDDPADVVEVEDKAAKKK